MSFLRFFVKRLLHGVLVVWGVVTLVFILRFITPGNPINAVAPLDASQQTRHAIAVELGLNKPLYMQYVDYLWQLLHGSLGYSYIKHVSVVGRVFARLPSTIELAVAATVVAVVLSIPLGVLSATRRHQPTDYAATTLSLGGISTPNFWLGIMLVLLLSVSFGIFPVGHEPVGFVQAVSMLGHGDTSGLVNWLAHITLPAVTLGTYFTALITRLTRSGMLDELGKSYVRALRG